MLEIRKYRHQLKYELCRSHVDLFDHELHILAVYGIACFATVSRGGCDKLSAGSAADDRLVSQPAKEFRCPRFPIYFAGRALLYFDSKEDWEAYPPSLWRGLYAQGALIGIGCIQKCPRYTCMHRAPPLDFRNQKNMVLDQKVCFFVPRIIFGKKI